VIATKFAFLDINNMYPNIHIKGIITLRNLGEINNIEDKAKQDILKITRVIVEQNISPLKHDPPTKWKV
jgi:hypothetical protein